MRFQFFKRRGDYSRATSSWCGVSLLRISFYIYFEDIRQYFSVSRMFSDGRGIWRWDY